MAHPLDRLWRRLGWRADHATGAEMVISGYLVACGAAWLVAGNGMQGISSYRIMLSVMADDAWGALWVALGMAWTLASWRHWTGARRGIGIVAAGILCWCGVTLALSNPATSVGWGLAVLGISAAAVSQRIR